MPRRSSLSPSTIGRIWRKFYLKPHLADGFKLSSDPLFVEKVIDVVELYHNPPEKAVVLCVDEELQIQALNRSRRAADDAGNTRAAHPRLRPARDHQPVRRVQYRGRHRHLFAAPPAPCRRLQEIPHQDRQDRPRGTRHPPDLRQLCHPQDPRDPGMARPPPPRQNSLHPDRIVVDQSGGTVVRVPDRQAHPPRRPHQRPDPPSGHQNCIDTWNQHPRPFAWTKTTEEILHSLAEYLAKISVPPTEKTIVYGFMYLQDGPQRRQMQVTRRQAPWPARAARRDERLNHARAGSARQRRQLVSRVASPAPRARGVPPGGFRPGGSARGVPPGGFRPGGSARAVGYCRDGQPSGQAVRLACLAIRGTG